MVNKTKEGYMITTTADLSYECNVDLYTSIAMSSELVLQVINRIDCVLSKLSGVTECRYYIAKHFNLITNNCDVEVVAQYYAALQSFNNDFAMHLPTVAKEAIDSFDPIKQHSKLFKCNVGKSAYDLSDLLFIEHAEMNPYLSFNRGHLSAYTVVNAAVINLVLALTCDMVQQTNHSSQGSLKNVYVPSVLKVLNLD